MKATEISNTQDIIDSCDIIARIAELRDELDALISDTETDDGDDRAEALDALADWLGYQGDPAAIIAADLSANADLGRFATSEDAAELATLEALAAEAEGYGDWAHGETLIRESHFTEYAEELASALSDYDPRQARWPFTCIDWEQAADELRMDYTEVDFGGVAYLMRA